MESLRCGCVVRLEVATADAGGRASSTAPIGALGGNVAGDLRRYQLWSRDPTLCPCGSGFNLSSGVELVWVDRIAASLT